MQRTVAARLLAATRPGFLPASILPVVLGSAWGARSAGGADIPALALALVATALVHAASNVYNDVSDELLGTDRANEGRIGPYTGGSRAIQDGILSIGEMRAFAVALAAAASLAGAALALRAGPGVLAFGASGALIGLAYSMPGLRLSGRGLGELAIATAFGLLPVSGAAWLQSGALDPDAALLSLPVSAWIAAVILTNEVPDAVADAITGKRTLAVRLGARTPFAVAMLQAGGFAAIAACAARGLVPAFALLPYGLLLAVALDAARSLRGPRAGLRRAIRTTLAVHATGTIGLLMALLTGS